MKEEDKIKLETLIEAGHGYKFISKQLNINVNTCKSACRKYNLNKGLPPKVKDYKGKLSKRQPLEISRYIKQHMNITRRDIILDLNLDVTPTTLSNYFKRYNIIKKKERQGPVISARNRLKRVEFAKLMLNKPDEYLQNIMWSDETIVKAYPNGEITVYWDDECSDERIDVVSAKVQQCGISVQFWGCMSFYAWGPLMEFDGWVDAQSYLEITLKNYLLPEMEASSKNLVFQQDNARPHTGKKVLEWLRKQKFETIEWPPQSPDLSPIELVWNILKMRLKALRPRPRTKADISAAFHKLYSELDDGIRMKTINLFRNKLKECIEINGYPVKYPAKFKRVLTNYHTDIESNYGSDDEYVE